MDLLTGSLKMGLLNVINLAVKTADKVTKDLQPEVTFERYLSSDGAGGKTYASPVGLKAIVEDKQQIVRTLSGELSQSKTTIIFLDIKALLAATGGNGVQEADKITLPSGESGPILSVGGFISRETGIPVATEVFLG